ncbi:hypothetical protein GGTG_13383 [Gaeumannomyces tritici R3-111a-1]|uniref:Uncharacterized protein n=1 Tax=Gaeumannomyces tritici (strain R3-111a-1) TaxID=644352 RepID=J3PIQ4_GAET3|nr:hypothetical protein GGTG_13383 [Gaeumannomyces tritici R3-111a-1]EJT69115.1 hypothetical protein GGTG_13383 [Gaeumannomyces tritici R3-111a-1]
MRTPSWAHRPVGAAALADMLPLKLGLVSVDNHIGDIGFRYFVGVAERLVLLVA